MSDLPVHLDLHLIRVLYLLLCDKSISRVALRLGRPQSSIFLALRKLRELTGDQLLVRGKSGMITTSHGDRLLKPAKRILDETDRLFGRTVPFNGRNERHTFRLAVPDYLDPEFLLTIVGNVRHASPQSHLVICSLIAVDGYERRLIDGDLDLVIGNWDNPPTHMQRSELLEDPIVCAMWADSAYAKRTNPDEMTAKDYLSFTHVTPADILPSHPGGIESHLTRHKLVRHVAVESDYFTSTPHMLLQTDLVLTTGRQFLRFYERHLPLKIFEVPIKLKPMRFYMLWHENTHNSPEQQWFRNVVNNAAKCFYKTSSEFAF